MDAMSSVLSFNDLDLGPVLEEGIKGEREKGKDGPLHEATFMKQFFYCLLMIIMNVRYVFITYTCLFLQFLSKYSFSLSVSTALNFSHTMEIKDVNGRPHPLTQYQVQMILVIGWVCFFISWICNIIYYKVHPSGVDFNLGRSRARLFIYFLGKKVKLPGYRDGDEREVAGAELNADDKEDVHD